VLALAQRSRPFLIRAVRHLVTETRGRQFLDIGTGLPTMDNTHQVAQRAAPECRVVYVDNDPLVLAHTHALLVNTTPDAVTAYIDADLHDPDQLITDAKNILNFTRPIAVLFMGVLGHVADYDESRSIMNRVMAATWRYGTTSLPRWPWSRPTRATRRPAQWPTTHARSSSQIAGYFDGMELVDPGVVSVSRWRPNVTEIGKHEPVSGHGAVARKP
jgi:hypothetical protein